MHVFSSIFLPVVFKAYVVNAAAAAAAAAPAAAAVVVVVAYLVRVKTSRLSGSCFLVVDVDDDIVVIFDGVAIVIIFAVVAIRESLFQVPPFSD